ncbi:MAG TPA: hypothetical protein VIK14_12400 [Ignavibacteria bacterium]
MGIKVLDIIDYTPKASDIFFFDNTIWMYLFCPLGDYNKKKQKHYSSFLKSIGSSNSTIFITSLILSEFTNRYLRLDFDLWKKETSKFTASFKKDYIGTQRYKDTISEIVVSIKNILGLCEKTPDNFNAININNVFNHLSFIDFNDSYYIELANLGKYKIVTDDYDFISYQNHNIEVFTITR